MDSVDRAILRLCAAAYATSEVPSDENIDVLRRALTDYDEVNAASRTRLTVSDWRLIGPRKWVTESGHTLAAGSRAMSDGYPYVLNDLVETTHNSHARALDWACEMINSRRV